MVAATMDKEFFMECWFEGQVRSASVCMFLWVLCVLCLYMSFQTHSIRSTGFKRGCTRLTQCLHSTNVGFTQHLLSKNSIKASSTLQQR